MRLINGEEIFGVDIDSQTRCAHWHSPLDVIAIRFYCCGRWFSCYECHNELAGHDPKPIPPQLHNGRASVICGVCGHKMSVNEYKSCKSSCPQCSADFNAGCEKHYHLYFE